MPSVITSRGPHHVSLDAGRVAVLVVASEGITPDEIDAAFAARREMESRYPDGFVGLHDMRTVEALLAPATRSLIAAYARVQRPGRILSRAVLVPADPVDAERLRAFYALYAQAPGVRCPERHVHTVEDACEFLRLFVPSIDSQAVAGLVATARELFEEEERVVNANASAPFGRSRGAPG